MTCKLWRGVTTVYSGGARHVWLCRPLTSAGHVVMTDNGRCFTHFRIMDTTGIAARKKVGISGLYRAVFAEQIVHAKRAKVGCFNVTSRALTMAILNKY